MIVGVLRRLKISVLEKLSVAQPTAEQQPENPYVAPVVDGPVSFSLANAEIILQPLIAACDSGFVKMVEPAMDCIQIDSLRSHQG